MKSSKFNKYRNIKSGGCDSKVEANRAFYLEVLNNAGEITNLQKQVAFELIPAQYEFIKVDGKLKRKCVERSCKYIADFVYENRDGVRVVEDVKGSKYLETKDFVIKRKLMLQRYGIKINMVYMG